MQNCLLTPSGLSGGGEGGKCPFLFNHKSAFLEKEMDVDTLYLLKLRSWHKDESSSLLGASSSHKTFRR